MLRLAVNPDALEKSEAGHDNKEKCASIAHKREGEPGDWSHGNSHSYIHENMSEEEDDDAGADQSA